MKKMLWVVLNILTLGAASLITNYVAKRREKAAVSERVRRYAKALVAIPPSTIPPEAGKPCKSRRTPISEFAAPKRTLVAVRHNHRRVVGELGGSLGRGNRIMVVLPDGKCVTRRRANTKVVSATA